MDYSSAKEAWDQLNSSAFWVGQNGDISSISGSSNPSSPQDIHNLFNSSIQSLIGDCAIGNPKDDASHRPRVLDAHRSSTEWHSETPKDHKQPAVSEKESPSNQNFRRRAQNRASQRAFRERKERHLKALEFQLEDLHEKHQDLIQSYSKQADEVSRLNTRITELTSQLGTLRSAQNLYLDVSGSSADFESFDAYFSSDVMPQGNGISSNDSVMNVTSDFI